MGIERLEAPDIIGRITLGGSGTVALSRSNVATLTGTTTLDGTSAPYQILDPGGSSRNLVFPDETQSKNLGFVVQNTADAAENIVGKASDGSTTKFTIGQSETAICYCDGSAWAAIVVPSGGASDSYVLSSLFDANTILVADSDNTPLALTVGASTFVGRKSSGGIAAMTPAEARAELEYGSSANGKGAALVGLEDAAGRYSSSTVEGAFTEVPVLGQLQGTGGSQGASLIGIQDSANRYAQSTAEGAFAELGESRTYRRYTRIANTAVRTLNATPVELVPAPGAPAFLEFVRAHIWLDYATAAFDAVAAGDDLAIKYTDASGAKVAVDCTAVGFADQASDQHRIVGPATGVVTPVANAPLVAHVLVGEWYAAAGGGDLVIETVYRIRTLEPAA